MIMELSKTLPGILDTGEEESSEDRNVQADPIVSGSPDQAQLPVVGEKSNMDFAFKIPVARLELFGTKAISPGSLKEASIAAFAINASHVQYQSRADGSSEANVTVKSIAMSNTRPGNSVYRELIPEGKRRGNQL
jgi:hypothetical protein